MKRRIVQEKVNLVRVVAAACALTVALTLAPGFKTEARAGDTGAFLGGLVAGKVVGDAIRRDKIRTAAAVETANQNRTVVVQQPSGGGSAVQTTEQKLDNLDKLAAGGYITPEEYKQRRKAILDAQ